MSTTTDYLHEIADELRHLADRLDGLAYPGVLLDSTTADHGLAPEPVDPEADQHRCTGCRATVTTCDQRVAVRGFPCCATCHLTSAHGLTRDQDVERMRLIMAAQARTTKAV